MALVLGSKLLDSGLGYVSSSADRIYICSAQPTSYAEATSTFALGYKDFGVGGVAGAPGAGTGTRRVVTNPVSGGTISAVGTVAYWAVVDTVNSLLLATGELTGGVLTTMGLNWTLGQIAIARDGVLSGPINDVATTAWVAAVVSAGGTVSAGRRTTVDNLIIGLKADGVWTKLDRLWLFAAENSQSALIDLVALDQATAVNSPTFTTDRGYAGNGSSSYIDTTFNASTQGVNFAATNNQHISIWNNTSRAAVTNAATGVWIDNGHENTLYLYTTAFGPAGFGARLVDSFNTVAVVNTTSQGFFTASNPAAGSQRLFFNGALLGTGTVGASQAINGSFYVSARDDNGTPTNYASDQFAMVSYGGGLTDTEVANFYSRLRTYMTAVGVP